MARNHDFPENFRTYEMQVAEMFWFIEVKNDVELTHCIILTRVIRAMLFLTPFRNFSKVIKIIHLI